MDDCRVIFSHWMELEQDPFASSPTGSGNRNAQRGGLVVRAGRGHMRGRSRHSMETEMQVGPCYVPSTLRAHIRSHDQKPCMTELYPSTMFAHIRAHG